MVYYTRTPMPFKNIYANFSIIRLHEVVIGISYCIISIFYVYLRYSKLLFEYTFLQKLYSSSNRNEFESDKWARVQIYSLSLIFKLWNKPHYRSKSYQQDMIDNLKNVAIPGTGIPLSTFCHNYWIAIFFIFFINPCICFWGACNKSIVESFTVQDYFVKLTEFFQIHLLHPDDWFSFWRLNCRLVSYHSWLTQSKDYQQEDKWTFLTTGNTLHVPISPYMENIPTIVCKNKNIEGGMGILFFKNAAFDGDWIIQEQLHNSEWLNKLLPNNAPLSTMRIITTSTWSLDHPMNTMKTSSKSSTSSNGATNDAKKYIHAESAVLRLGRQGAATDHSSSLFDVEIELGRIRYGRSNSQWYQLGIKKILSCPWLPNDYHYPFRTVRHPDPPNPVVTGEIVPNMAEAVDIVINAHFKMMRDVPIVGWDVAFTTIGIVLLEVNLSCNFFRGQFDIPRYIDFIDKSWVMLEKLEKESIKK